jgi:hypothetical protein
MASEIEVGTLASGEVTTINIPSSHSIRHIQITSANTGTLQIETREKKMSNYVTQATITTKSIVLDMIDVELIRLTASSATVEYSVREYRDS